MLMNYKSAVIKVLKGLEVGTLIVVKHASTTYGEIDKSRSPPYPFQKMLTAPRVSCGRLTPFTNAPTLEDAYRDGFQILGGAPLNTPTRITKFDEVLEIRNVDFNILYKKADK